MQKNRTRRWFIKLAAVIIPGLTVRAKSLTLPGKEKKMKELPVKDIQPLGFVWDTKDPFLFCVHHEDYYPAGNEQQGLASHHLEGRNLGADFEVKDGFRMYHGKKTPGFPSHPHTGFETVTLVRTGFVDHSDSLGAKGRYGSGDVQWMTAGKGIQHAEMFPLINQDKDNPLELFQVWLNLPGVNKLVKSYFKMLWAEHIPVLKIKDEQGKIIKIEVIAGAMGKHAPPSPPPDSWASVKDNEVAIWNIQMEKGAKWKLPAKRSGVTRMIYFYRGGQLKVGNHLIENYHSAEQAVDNELVVESIGEAANILILQGKPINEPVVKYGPFVMNTREEIQDVFDRYKQTSFGGWPHERPDPVHDIKRGRFAIHADGRLGEFGTKK